MRIFVGGAFGHRNGVVFKKIRRNRTHCQCGAEFTECLTCNYVAYCNNGDNCIYCGTHGQWEELKLLKAEKAKKEWVAAAILGAILISLVFMIPDHWENAIETGMYVVGGTAFLGWVLLNI